MYVVYGEFNCGSFDCDRSSRYDSRFQFLYLSNSLVPIPVTYSSSMMITQMTQCLSTKYGVYYTQEYKEKRRKRVDAKNRQKRKGSLDLLLLPRSWGS